MEFKPPCETRYIPWKATLDIIPSKERINRIMEVSDGECYLCGHDMDSTHHLVFSCLVIIGLW